MKLPGAHIGYRKVGKLNIVHDKSRRDGWPDAGRSVTMPEKGELISKCPAVRRFYVAGEIPPFRPELIVWEMVSRQGDLITGHGNGPSLFIRNLPPSRANNGENGDPREVTFHASILTASIIFRRAAWFAGHQLAKAAAGNIHTGIHRSWSHGIWRGIVQPKKALFITSVSTTESATPVTTPSKTAIIPTNIDSQRMSPRTWRHETPTALRVPISLSRSLTSTVKLSAIPIPATRIAISRRICVTANV